MTLTARGNSELPVISLFSGAGGLDLGVADVGGHVRVCVEADRDAVATLRANSRFHSESKVIDSPIEFVSSTDILRAGRLAKGEAALLIGGPPCQPFSKAGYWLQERREGANDGRAWYLNEYLRVLRDTRPAGFILENVPSLLHSRHREGLDYVLWRSARLGYSVDYRVLHSAEYGVPQSRARLFVIGLLGKHPPSFPDASHWWHSENGRRLKPPETAGGWIADLDREELFEPEEAISGRWEAQLREVPPGSNYKHLTAWAGHPRPKFVTETKYWSFLLKLNPRRPAWTIQAQPGPWTGPFHWTTRRLRMPELAALQTFPSSYRFEGQRRSRMRQIGNAVPCLLASKVAAALVTPIIGKRPVARRVLRFELADGYEFDRATLSHNGHRW